VTQPKRLKALKINTPEIYKYPFNINGSVKHICVCFCSWSHLILSQDFPPLFVNPLTLSVWPCFLKIQIFWSLNTWNWYPFMQRKERKLQPFLMLLNRVILLNGNTFSRFLFNTNHQNDYSNQAIWIQLYNWLEIININMRNQTF
jgi:hypothetical protein